MLPSILLAAVFAGRDALTPNTPRVIYLKPPDSIQLFEATIPGIPPFYPIEVCGDPPHLRNYPWGGGSARPSTGEKAPLVIPFLPPQVPKRQQFAPVPPHDPTADRIKAIENVILELRARSGSAAVIEQLQHDLDELKAMQKKAK